MNLVMSIKKIILDSKVCCILHLDWNILVFQFTICDYTYKVHLANGIVQYINKVIHSLVIYINSYGYLSMSIIFS